MPAIEMFPKVFVGTTYTQDSTQVTDAIGFNFATAQWWVEPALAVGDSITVAIQHANLNDEGAFITSGALTTIVFDSTTSTTLVEAFANFGRYLRAEVQVTLTSGAKGYNLRGVLSLKLSSSASPAPATYTGPYDWADPHYESAGDQLTAIDVGAWEDAGGSFGGATTIQMATIDSRLLAANNGYDSGGSPLTSNRENGILIPVPSGDFTRYMRVGFRRNVPFGTTSASAVKALAVFVDGAGSTSAWYGGGVSWSAGDEQIEVCTGTQTSWGAASYTGIALIYGGITTFDFALKRAGTNLSVYLAAERGRLLSLKSTPFTVSTGAGYVGLRFETLSGTSQNVSGLLYAYRESLTEIP